MERIINAGGFVEFGRVNGMYFLDKNEYKMNGQFLTLFIITVFLFLSVLFLSNSRQLGTFSRYW